MAKKLPPHTPIDFRVRDHGSIVLVTPLSPTAKQLVADRFEIEGWQWIGDAFGVDHRLAQDLINRLSFEGYVID